MRHGYAVLLRAEYDDVMRRVDKMRTRARDDAQREAPRIYAMLDDAR